MILYHVLDLFFLIFHLILTLFNLVGWIWRKTRKLNLFTLLITGFSWSVLGIFFGWGYCPLTDWHFRVLRHLGETALPDSYIRYLLMRLFRLDMPAQTVNTFTLLLFLLALGISLYLNLRKK